MKYAPRPAIKKPLIADVIKFLMAGGVIQHV